MSISNSRGEDILHWVLSILGALLFLAVMVSCIKSDNANSASYNACIRAGYEVVPIVNGTVCRDREGHVVDEWGP